MTNTKGTTMIRTFVALVATTIALGAAKPPAPAAGPSILERARPEF